MFVQWKRTLRGVFVGFLAALLVAGFVPTGPLAHPYAAGVQAAPATQTAFDFAAVPAYTGQSAFAIVNNNVPYFKAEELTATPFNHYTELDALGRCGTAYANICKELMPTKERGQIGMIKPSGWQLVKYDNVDGKFLFNRCHLIGYQLAGENANTKNLITGTRYLNVDGMLPFENMVAGYVNATGNHVLYRVTPVFVGNELVCRGVLIEAESIEDAGKGIMLNVFCYNVQPGIVIDYATGNSAYVGGETAAQAAATSVVVAQPAGTAVIAPAATNSAATTANAATPVSAHYVANKNSKKFHYATCDSVQKMSEKNKLPYDGDRADLIAQGYVPCKRCNP